MAAGLTRLEVEDAVRVAASAPSVLNVQPWRFVARGASIEVHADPNRTLPVLDPQHRATTLSCGAALFNLALAVAVLGRRPRVEILPDGSRSALLGRVEAGVEAPPEPDEIRLHAAVPSRRTSRVPFTEQPVAPEWVVALEAAATRQRATLRVLTGEEITEALRLVEHADRAQRANPHVRQEIARWTGPRPAGDGIPDSALGPTDTGPGASLVRDFAMGLPVARRGEAEYERTPTLAVLLTARDDAAAWLHAGQALERVWLEATALGLAVSLLTQPMELSNLRWLARSAAGSAAESAAGSAAGMAAGSAVDPGLGQLATERLWPQVLLRLGIARGSTPPTPRRPLTDVLSFA